MTLPVWTDWLTRSTFRIRVAPAAVEKLGRLPESTQLRLKQMVEDITELADLVPPSTARAWTIDESTSPLNLHLGRVVVRYSIDESSRTLTIAHVIVPDEGFGQTG